MVIGGYLKTSLIEWPGKITAIVFTQGCNFKCPFCHNRELVKTGTSGKEVYLEEIVDDLKKRRKWLDAVAVTGGEPTLQQGLPGFLVRLEEMGLLRMVETNGTNPTVVKQLIDNKLVDCWAMDLKGNLGGYGEFAGVGGNWAETIKKSVQLIVGSGVEYEFRTTVVPGLHTPENLVKLAREIRQICGTGPIGGIKKSKGSELKWFLQQFRPVNCLDESYLGKKPFPEKQLREILTEVKKVLPQTALRGI